MSVRDKDTVNAVQISCSILDALRRKGGAGITELAKELDHSKSTIHSHLATLRANELVAKDGERYRLSLRHLYLAEHVKRQVGNYGIIADELDALAEATQEVAQFGVAEHGRITYLCKERSDQGVETASRVGASQPLHSTGLGKAALASMTDDRIREIVAERGLEAKTDNTITDRDQLFERLARIRKRGYAVDDEENVEGIRCIAAPVNWDSVYGAVSVTGPTSRFRGERFEQELPDHVRHTANVIEINSRFRTP